MKKPVFICHTVYHVYISLLKSYSLPSASIALVDTIDDFENLTAKLVKAGVFCDVISLDRDVFFGKRIKYFFGNYINNRLRCKSIQKQMNFLRKYDEIYLFNDYTEIGDYLELSGLRYHLLEDGLDVFKQFDIYEDIGHAHALKKGLYLLFKIPFSVGMNSSCIDIEVNDKNGLKTELKHPVIEVKRSDLLNNVSKDYMEKVNKVFGIVPVDVSRGRKLLLLTQVLKEILVVDNDEEQIEIYRNALRAYADNYDIYIKAHPRDNIDYSSFEQEFHAVCLKKNVPMELYAQLPNMNFDIILTYSSTAANIKGIGSNVIRLDSRL
ncbi:MAG: glycosyltransferase family 52 [Stomatobaculum sp.]